MRAKWPYKLFRFADATVGADALGNDVTTWAEPIELMAYGWAPPRSAEPSGNNVQVLTVDLELMAPTAEIASEDELEVDGKRYTVVGEPGDYDHGPFGYAPGMLVRLKRAK